MKEVMEAFLGTFFMLLMSATSLSCISAAIDYRNADATKTAYIAEMENSNFSSKVIAQICEQAEKDGYDVQLTLYHSQDYLGSPTPKLTTKYPDESNPNLSLEDAIGNTSDVYMIRVQLDSDYSFDFFNNAVTKHTLIGYAR